MSTTTATNRLFVFFPTPARPIAVQKELVGIFPGFEVTVFGRYVDFVATMHSDQPDLIMISPLLLNQCSGYQPVLTGAEAGRKEQSFMLLSLDSAVQIKDIASHSLGVVDFLGKEGMDHLAARFFKTPPKLKRVTKMEDLLPLLGLGMVDAVLVSNQQADYLRQNSRLNLVGVVLPEVQEGYLVLATRAGGVSKLKNPGRIAIMGVEQWK